MFFLLEKTKFHFGQLSEEGSSAAQGADPEELSSPPLCSRVELRFSCAQAGEKNRGSKRAVKAAAQICLLPEERYFLREPAAPV